LGLESGKVCSDFARELERDLATRTAERDEAREQLRLANIDQFNSEAEVAALKAHDPLAEMWRELEAYQEQADRDGHGESWRAMCSEKTHAAASYAVREATWAAAWNAWDAARAAERAAEGARDAIAAIRRAKEGR
jgi:hypothetical protein